jgi:hypothetical protein
MMLLVWALVLAAIVAVIWLSIWQAKQPWDEWDEDE